MDANAVVELPVTVSDAPDAPPRERRVLAALALATFLAVVNFSASAPFFPQIADDLGTTVPLLGQLPTTITLVAALLGLAVGPLADRHGHRRLMLVGIAAAAVNLLGIGLATSYPVLLALAVSGGLGDAILFGIPLALAGTLFHGDARRRAIGWTSAALPAGAVLGVPLLTAAGEFVAWRVVFLAAGLATLASATLALAWLPETHGPARPGERLLAVYRPLLRHRPLLVLLAAGALRMGSWSGATVYLGAFLAEELGFRPGAVGAAYLLSGAAVLLGSILTGRLRRVPLRPLAARSAALQGVLLALVFVLPAGAAGALALLVAASFASAFAYVALMTLTVGEAQRSGGGTATATAMILTGSVLNLGVAVGGAAGGLLLAAGGWQALGLGLPPLALLGAALLSRGVSRER